MDTPAFEEFDPPNDCECPGCVRRPHLPPRSTGSGGAGRPAAQGALVLAAAAGAALGAGPCGTVAAAAHAPVRPGVVADEEPDAPQGGEAPLHGPAGRQASGAELRPPVAPPATTRAEIINRAKTWVAARVPYSMTAFWSDGYRQDCSGYVSMAWNLGRNEWTGSLATYGDRISKEELQPGDILLFHNPEDPLEGSHVVIFGGWTDYTHTHYIAYEQTRPHTRKQATPYAYWSNSERYVAYRYKGLAGDAGGGAEGAEEGAQEWAGAGGARFPGVSAFGSGARNGHVTRLGRMLVERGGARFYTTGPGPRWTAADRRATQAFQRAQGWTGSAADGLPGPVTWAYLAGGAGRDIPPGRLPRYPGRGTFRPGADNEYVTRLGRRLIEKGFGTYYASGPGPCWTEADRRSVEAFQRAQGWRGRAADGYPGPETWRRLFL
ncbi:peptidoglycan-binding protein [Streptomyces poonensis]|uniref:Membrane protein n=1 Tax=Streptomyces poonensis TaxID=68255 RepID=A0A918PU02_9ACTN|nr:peptidoglycan-binding protein [Streptomyces poonensis]GGZ22874.1 membrane protein [Streptomyces poonensis]GLJ91874.1 membrane protein [Streptomyces poonensis]